MIGSYLSALRRHLGVITLVTLLVAPVAFFALTAGNRTYESVAVVQVGSRLAAGVVGLDTPYEEVESLLATETEYFESDAVSVRARALLAEQGWTETAQELSERVTVTGRGLSNLVDVTGTGPDPERARALTNAFVTAYVTTRQQNQRAAVQDVVDDLSAQREQAEAQLAALDAEGDDSDAAERDRVATQSWYDSLTDQIEQARLRLSVDTSGVVPVSPAGLGTPTEAMGPAVAAIVSLLGGLLVSAGLVLLLDLMRDPVRTRSEVQDLLDAPVLGEVAGTGGDGRSGALVAASARGVRLRLEQLAGGSAPRTVAVTATPQHAVEAVRVGAALATAWGRAGLRVALVADPGSEAALTPLDLPGQDAETPVGHGTSARRTAVERVWLVPASSSGQRTGFTDHPAPDAVLSALRESFDVVVLVDARPQVPDVLAVASLVDSVLVVCALGVTPGKRLAGLNRALEQYGVHVSGTVLAPPRGRRDSAATRAERPDAPGSAQDTEPAQDTVTADPATGGAVSAARSTSK